MAAGRFVHLKLLIITVMLATGMLAGCSSAPDNLEPVLEIVDVSDVTRTEAIITASVHKQGTGNLTFLSFYYGEPGNVTTELKMSNPNAEIHTLHLRELKAGTTYSCYIAGGTSTASLMSPEVQFTTQPNDRPTVSAPVMLSTGPVGVIISFDIVEDGGEPILNGGCDVVATTTGETKRFELSPDDLTEGSHRINIVGLNVDTQYTLTPFASNSTGEARGESLAFTTANSVVLDCPGALSSLFDGEQYIDLGSLTIAGDMDGDDFRFLRLMLGAPALFGGSEIESSVTEVDLTGVNIVEGGESFDGSRYTQADVISTGLLAGCERLQEIVLPVSATRLERDALAGCTALKELTVPAGIESLLPSADCPGLEAINVSPANQNYTSIDGVLFNSDGTEILWFPLGKTGDYRLPETITAIGENAFYGTSITGLEIPESVTEISRGAFAGTSLVLITLPDNLTNVSEAMFQNCTSLTTVKLGSGTAYIGDYAFDGTSITDMYLSARTPPYTTADAFYNRSFPFPEECTLHVPAGCKTIYRNHRQWGQFKKFVEF